MPYGKSIKGETIRENPDRENRKPQLGVGGQIWW
jgi:hypothetical protein